MKTLLLIQDGKTQIVMTPESDWEKTVLAGTNDKMTVKPYQGSFRDCRGGWVREYAEDTSLIITLHKEF